MSYKFSTEELLAALQNGANPDDIAQQFSDALNGAIAAKRAEEQNSKKRIALRQATLSGIVNSLLNFIEEFYPDMYDDELEDSIDIASLDEAIEDAYKSVEQLKTLFGEDVLKNTAAPKKSVNPDDAIAKFLRNAGL